MPDPIVRLNAALEGRYRIERELGEGGMATVYLADDLKHERKVALKVLKPELAAVVGAERFLTEIKTTANLQHPHILPLFDSGEADTYLFYVMPYVEGETLRDRLDREHQLPVDEAVQIVTNVAEALDYAHRQGVIHRDIKPANILLQDGKPVISDFGIALAVGVAGGGRLTETGLSLGTPHYMSPEQATGDLSVGAKTDVYALGCVLYEMLVGEPPYTGSTAQAILGKIIAGKLASATEERASVPANVDAAIRKSLEKLPADRFTGAQELAKALGDTGFRHGDETGDVVRSGAWNRLTVGLAASTAVLALALGVVWQTAPGRDQAGSAFFADIVLPDSEPLALVGPAPLGVWQTALAVSPDGQTLAYVSPHEATTLLYVRDSRGDVQPLPMTEGAYSPFFSPDGQWIGFFTGKELKKVQVSGGTPLTLSQGVQGEGGAAWAENERILIAGETRWGWVPASAGPIQLLPDPPQERFTRFGDPQILPGGDWALGSMTVTGQIAVLSLETGMLYGVTSNGTVPLEMVPLSDMLIGSSARYISGYLTYLSHADGVMMAIPFDAGSRRVTGNPFPVLNNARRESVRGRGQHVLSADGTLFYAPGGNEGLGHLAIVGPGEAVDTLRQFQRDQYHGVRMSPDGSRIATFEWFETVGGSGMKILNLESGAVDQLPLDAEFHYATGEWTPGGDSLLIKRYDPVTSAGRGALFWRVSDGQVLEFNNDWSITFTDFLPDGDHFVWSGFGDGEAGFNMTSLSSDQTETGPLLGHQLSVSPDGGWLAFVREDEQGIRMALTTIPPSTSWRTIVFEGEPDTPEWTSDGASIIYRDIRTFKQIDLKIRGDTVRPGEPRIYAEGPFHRVWHSTFDVTPDDRVLAVLGSPETSTTQLKMITRFDLEIARRAAESGN